MRCSHFICRTTPFLLAVRMGWSFSISAKTDTSRIPGWQISSKGCRSSVPNVSPRALTDFDLGEEEEAEESRPPGAILVFGFPLAATVSAFGFYKETSSGFHSFVQHVSQNSWIPVDGGKLIGEIILPALNGPVLGSISLLFATLVAMTISNLYQRQVAIRGCLVREVEELRRLGFLLQSLPQPYRAEGRTHLGKYADYLFEAAANRSLGKDGRRNQDMNDVFLLMNKVAVDSAREKSIPVSGAIVGEGYELVRRINDERTRLSTLLLSAFPPLHYVNMIVLATSICFAFLMETDRDVMFFLAGFQLRFLWAMLIGTLALMATVIYDLATPFEGSYTVFSATDEELESLKDYVTAPWDD